MTLTALKFAPGIYKDDTELEAEGYWINADKMRFARGVPETIYGWERASTSTLLGITRGMLTWADNSRNPYAAFGTNLRLYAMDLDGNVTDITPIASRTAGTLIKFSTTVGSTALAAAFTHTLIANQEITLGISNPTTLGGVTLDGTYAVTSVTDSYNLTLTAGQTATTTTGSTPTTTYLTTYLAPGQADGLGGLGFGTGGYGSGGYASASSGLTYYPRTWSLSAWGQNLIANPRGGGVYEWAPYTAQTELVTNGAFSAITGWTLGAGWTYVGDSALATASGASATQIVTTPAGAWCQVGVDLSTVSTGGLQISYAGTNVGTSQTANGRYRTSFFTSGGGAATLSFTGTNFSGAIDNVSLYALASGNLITNAPTVVTCSFVTAERFLVACGCNDTSNNFDALRVRWSDQMANQTWTASTSNLAGSYTLSQGTRIVRGLPGNRENVILTDTSLYVMRYVPDPSVVYSFLPVATGCGLIGPNAVTEIGGIWYWMSPDGGFWKYDGSYPVPLRCTLGRDLTDNLAFVQQDKIYAVPMTIRGRLEVWWFYPDSRDGTECSRYVAYQITESDEAGLPVWINGIFARTSGATAGVFQYPLMVDTSGSVWFHEKGFSADGGSRSWSITSARNNLGDGDLQTRVINYIPDHVTDVQGGYTVTLSLFTKNLAGILETTKGPYNVLSTSGKVNVRGTGQEFQITYAGDGAPTFWRKGADALDIRPTARRR